jgi:hypothetical protein
MSALIQQANYFITTACKNIINDVTVLLGEMVWHSDILGALHYKLGIDIQVGDLIWIHGLYPASTWPDIKIFTTILAFLEEYEQVEANYGYYGLANKVKCPLNDITLVKKLVMQAWVWAHHKTINWCLKTGLSP